MHLSSELILSAMGFVKQLTGPFHPVRIKNNHGANHEKNIRAGTENVTGIVGLGHACAILKRDFDQNVQFQKQSRDYFFQKLKLKIPGIQLNGHPELRLPNTLNISFPGKEANILLKKMTNIAASAGAACHSDGINISQVLKAIRLPERLAIGTIRFSTGKFLTFDEIDKAIKTIVEIVQKND